MMMMMMMMMMMHDYVHWLSRLSRAHVERITYISDVCMRHRGRYFSYDELKYNKVNVYRKFYCGHYVIRFHNDTFIVQQICKKNS